MLGERGIATGVWCGLGERAVGREVYKRSMRKSAAAGHQGRGSWCASGWTAGAHVTVAVAGMCLRQRSGWRSGVLSAVRVAVIALVLSTGCGCAARRVEGDARAAVGGCLWVGPRIDAHIAMLAGVFRLSRDQVRQTVVEVFRIPASTGSIDNAIMRMSASRRSGLSCGTRSARPRRAYGRDDVAPSGSSAVAVGRGVGAGGVFSNRRPGPKRRQRRCWAMSSAGS